MKIKKGYLGIVLILSFILSSCQYITGDYRDKTNARKPGLYLEIKLEPIDVRQSTFSYSDMSHIKDIMEKRINSLGIISSVISWKGQTMTIEIEGYSNLEEAKNIIGKTGELLFTDEIGRIIVSGKNLKNSEFVFQNVSEGGTREPAVQITFDDEGIRLFEMGTKANLGKNLMITLDEEVLLTPQVNSVISDGKVVITFKGIDPEDAIKTAKEIASILKGGSIPAKVVFLKTELR